MQTNRYISSYAVQQIHWIQLIWLKQTRMVKQMFFFIYIYLIFLESIHYKMIRFRYMFSSVYIKTVLLYKQSDNRYCPFDFFSLYGSFIFNMAVIELILCTWAVSASAYSLSIIFCRVDAAEFKFACIEWYRIQYNVLNNSKIC